MKREQVEVYNLSDMASKHRLMGTIAKLQGLHEVYIKPQLKTRSLNANAYYFVAIATVFREWLREVWGDPTITTEQAHIEIKKAVLGMREKLNEHTGEMMELVPATHTMDKYDYAAFIDKATEFVENYTGIAILKPELFAEERNDRLRKVG